MATSDDSTRGIDSDGIARKYETERVKRFRAEGTGQYVEIETLSSPRLKELGDDPWVDHAALDRQLQRLSNGDEVRVLVVGAGYGGLFAVRLIEAGFVADDLRLVDRTGGFGGTWYWNRYPGLTCDTQSSLHIPLLEETGYVPRYRYAYGPELRRHVERIAARWRLDDKAAFRTSARGLAWDEAGGRWVVKLQQRRGPAGTDCGRAEMTVRAQFVVLATGVLQHPQAPRIPGLADFGGAMMHTARWDFGVSGGSADDWALRGLVGKRVGIIGTGATAVQCVPELARWAARLLVFQRTPTAVDERGQRRTDAEAWRRMTRRPGWWKRRNELWHGADPATLYGILSRSFPNLLLTGTAQAGASPNLVFAEDVLARHAAYVLSEAVARAADPARVVVEPSEEAEAAWTAHVAAHAAWLSPVSISCGPSYFNAEGAVARWSSEDAARARRAAIYPKGIIEYQAVLERWRDEGAMEGLDVASCSGGAAMPPSSELA